MKPVLHSLRLLCMGIALSVAAAASPAADADDYPNRPITVIVPLSAGGSGDVLTRFVMERVSKVIGQPVMVDNKPGGNLVIAARALLSAKPDGYTMLSTINAQITGKALMDVPYDPFKDFAPVAKMVTGYFVFAVHPKLPVNNFREFVEYAKAHPVSHGAFAPSSLGNVFAESMNDKLGTKITTAMYKGGAPIVNDLLSGTLDACLCTPQEVLQHANAGKLKILGTTAPTRSPLFAQVPTLAEQGFTGSPFDYGAWVGLVTSSGTPPERIRKFSDAVQVVMKQPEVIEFMRTAHALPEYENPATFKDYLVKNYAQWEADVRKAKIEIK